MTLFVIALIVLIVIIAWQYSDDLFQFCMLTFVFSSCSCILFLIVALVMDFRVYNANVSESIGCKQLVVHSEKQFEVWRKEKHGGTYSKLRYSITKNEFDISAIEFSPEDIIPSKKENNTILVEVIKTSNDVAETVEYSVNNQSRNCL